MVTEFTPIVNAGFLYVNNLQLQWLTATTIQVAGGQCRDSTNEEDMFLPSFTILNVAGNGLNGLDTGTIADSSSYNVYLIADPRGYQPTGVIASLTTAAQITMPNHNYSLQRRIGYFITDSSGNIVDFTAVGNGSERTYQYASVINILAAGTATTFTAIDLSTPVLAAPKVPGMLVLFSGQTSAGGTGQIRPTGSTVTTTVPWRVGGTAGIVNSQFMITGINSIFNPSIDYLVSAGNLNIWVNGFYDSL
jgi:hypothetical protein